MEGVEIREESWRPPEFSEFWLGGDSLKKRIRVLIDRASVNKGKELSPFTDNFSNGGAELLNGYFVYVLVSHGQKGVVYQVRLFNELPRFDRVNGKVITGTSIDSVIEEVSGIVGVPGKYESKVYDFGKLVGIVDRKVRDLREKEIDKVYANGWVIGVVRKEDKYEYYSADLYREDQVDNWLESCTPGMDLECEFNDNRRKDKYNFGNYKKKIFGLHSEDSQYLVLH